MYRKLQALLFYTFVLAAMSFAEWQLDSSIVTSTEAHWPNGCCKRSSDCPREHDLCWLIPGAENCGSRIETDEEGNAIIVELWGYCNKTRPNIEGFGTQE
jgi:hypothetical protein